MTLDDEMLAEIRSWHRRRVFAMDQRKRLDLALGAFLRLQLGWSRALPEAERAAINARAGLLIEAGLAEFTAAAAPEGRRGRPRKPRPGTGDPAFAAWRDMIMASVQARAAFAEVEGLAAREMDRLARTLPVWPWVESIPGFGAISLAVIVGECGDLANYPTKSHLWKRMGLAVFDGTRQGGLAKGAPAEEWRAHGYSRVRRSHMWVIGKALVQGNGTGQYRASYLARKDYEREMAETAGLTVAPAAKIPADASGYISLGHIDRRAQRYMEKRLLKHLWQAWRRARSSVADDDRPGRRLPEADIKSIMSDIAADRDCRGQGQVRLR